MHAAHLHSVRHVLSPEQSDSTQRGLTVDGSLPLPQRIGNAVDVVVDVVGGSGQLIHLRPEVTDGLMVAEKYAVMNEPIHRRSVKPISTILLCRLHSRGHANELKEMKTVFTDLTFLSCFSSAAFSSQPLGHKTPWWMEECLLDLSDFFIFLFSIKIQQKRSCWIVLCSYRSYSFQRRGSFQGSHWFPCNFFVNIIL